MDNLIYKFKKLPLREYQYSRFADEVRLPLRDAMEDESFTNSSSEESEDSSMELNSAPFEVSEEEQQRLNEELLYFLQQPRYNTDEIINILKQGADVNIYDSATGLTPLILAVIAGNLNLSELLLDLGANIDYQITGEYNGILNPTALMIAAYYNKPGMFNFLVEKGAKLDIENKYGDTAMGIAAKSGSFKILRDIKKYPSERENINYTFGNGDTLLMSAVISGSMNSVKEILEYNPDLNIRNVFGETALELAIYYENEDIANEIIKHGADVNILNSSGEPLLIMAIKDDLFDTAMTMINHGANVNALDKDGNSILLLIINNYPIEDLENAIQNLLNMGIDVNLQNKKGETALTRLIKRGVSDPQDDFTLNKVIKLLLENGADPNIGEYHNIGLNLSIQEGNIDLFEMLLENGANPNGSYDRLGYPIFLALDKHDNRYLTSLLERDDLDLTVRDITNETPLVYAIRKGLDFKAIEIMESPSGQKFLAENKEDLLKTARFYKRDDIISYIETNFKPGKLN